MKKTIFIPEIDSNTIPNTQRLIKDSNDWGDMKTVYARVMRIGANIYSSNSFFGVYLGRMDKRYCVGVFNEENNNISVMECFESISELKHNWILD